MVSKINGMLGNFGLPTPDDNLNVTTTTETLIEQTNISSTLDKLADMQTVGATLKSKLAALANAPQQQQTAHPVETNWRIEGSTKRNPIGLHNTKEDWDKTDELFYRKHPDLKGQKLKPGSAEAKEWINTLNYVVQNKYNDVIQQAVGKFQEAGPERLKGQSLDPKVLKALLVQESKLNPTAVSPTGPKGIAQFSRDAAERAGLSLSPKDERLDPEKAIPAAALHLGQKAKYLEENAFSKYGRPQGDEYMKFVTAAYNGGEATVVLAMKTAYEKGLREAEAKGLRGDDAVNAAKDYATKWDNIYPPNGEMKSAPYIHGDAEVFPCYP